MTRIEKFAVDIIACSNFKKLHYSVENNLLAGCINGCSWCDGKILGKISFHEFCQLLLILNRHNWKLDEEEKGYVILTK